MSDTFYTNEVRHFLKTREWPSGLIYEVIEFEERLQFRLFRDNINSLGSEAKLQLAKVINESLQSIRKQGVPVYTKVVSGDGRLPRG